MPRRQTFRRRSRIVALAAGTLVAAGCVHTFWQTEVRAVPLQARADTSSTFIESSLKAHLKDGSTVLFRGGASVSNIRMTGPGQRYEFMGIVSREQNSIPMDSIIGVEAFERNALALKGVVASVAGSLVVSVASVGLAIALFGSCPTVYSDTGTGPMLEAEGFSYSIAPLLESRDVDALRVRPDAKGVVRLELRNEAMETHYLNHVELLAVRHSANALVMPDQTGHTVAVSGFATVSRAVDRTGRDVRKALAFSDGQLFSSAPSVIQNAKEGDLDDWIELDAANLPAGDSVAVVLRLRNSLLNTVLLYEGMLGGRDAADWLNQSLQHIAYTVDVGRWYARTMGMRVSLERAQGSSNAAPLATTRMGDVGPIAFRDVAIVLPRSAVNASTSRVRLRFVADNWRIDQARIAGIIARPTVIALPVDSVLVPVSRNGRPAIDTAAIGALREADDTYFETIPTQRMSLVFHPAPAGAVSADSAVTYLIAWQGWYREWIRGSWLTHPTRTEPFVPGDAAVLTALRRWTERKPTFEKQFYESKLPVR